MTHRRPRRFTVSQCMQIFLTDAFTFMVCLAASGYPSPASVWIEMEVNLITDENLYFVQTHLAREVGEDEFPAFQLYAK